ncbi:hypothetical protein AMS68_004266 [Peltaster fructicola]|uniref:Uncharacterized protein n=1 Tax=Peltaster fructicola TaxID=286661 RepID=A0A6H0XVV2_9PEZI|nr:hypothetical protein AMS68_004266 [Peltaster fructicola]
MQAFVKVPQFAPHFMCLRKKVHHALQHAVPTPYEATASYHGTVMSKVSALQVVELHSPVQSPVTSDDDTSEVDFILDGEIEKDDTEKELERLVFGDAAGLKEGFKDFNLVDDELDTIGQTGLEGLADADLFFTDVEPTEGNDQVNLAVQPINQNERPAAWEDSEDERITISLASVPRLRKLRRTEAEDVVDGVEYSRRLRQQFELLNPRPEWAVEAMKSSTRKRRKLSQEDDNSDDDATFAGDDDDLPSAPPLSALLQNASSLTRSKPEARGKKRKLRPETISIQRTKDIPGVQPSAITSMSFHPNYPLLLSSGPSSTLYMHHIVASPPAPSANPLLISLHIRGTPLTTTAFCPNDSRIFLSARRKYFHVWDLDSGQVEKITQVAGHEKEQRSMEYFKISPDGKHIALQGSSRKGGGLVNILLASSLQWVAQVRVESRGGIADFAWWRDSRGLAIAAKNGEITEWSVEKQQVVARWQDEGAVGTTVLALGGQHEVVKSAVGNDRWIAIGSSSGIVNLYDRRLLLDQGKTLDQPIPLRPKPYKTLDHITTPTSHLKFSPDGQLLAMASKWKRDAMRLVHLPSATVYKNWPTSSTPLGRISAVAFADGELSGGNIHSLLAVANEQGKIRLWEVS